MPTLIRTYLFLFAASCAQFSFAQIDLQGEASGGDVIVHGRNKASEAGELLVQAVWRGIPGGQPSFDLQPMSASAQDYPLQLDRLIESGLGAYLDQRIHFSKQGVKADVHAERMTIEMAFMIKAAIGKLELDLDFDGFSAATKDQLSRLVVIDWSHARNAVNGGSDQDKYLAIYYYVRSQREEFERSMRRDLLAFAGIDVFQRDEEERELANISIGSSCGTVFDDDRYLCALDLKLADASGADVELPIDLVQAITEARPRSNEPVRKRDQWLKAELDRINERIDHMDQRKELWELRDRMDDLNDRLTGLELEVREGRSHEDENTLADLSDLTGHNITIRFTRGSTTIAPEYCGLLDEVHGQLKRSPKARILITGYTDRAGDAAVNMKLSEQRAKAVRQHFITRGIPPDRLLMNYYGGSRSDMNDPSQRRVEIEWLR